MKTTNLIWLLVIVLLLIFLLFFFFSSTAGKPKPDLGSALSCQTDKIAESVLALENQGNMIKAFVRFQKLPLTDEQQTKLKDLNVYLDPQTLTLDYMWGVIPVKSLCDLAQDDNVSQIFTLK